MNLSNFCKEIFRIEGREAWVRYRLVIKDMVSKKVGVKETLDELWVSGSF